MGRARSGICKLTSPWPYRDLALSSRLRCTNWRVGLSRNTTGPSEALCGDVESSIVAYGASLTKVYPSSTLWLDRAQSMVGAFSVAVVTRGCRLGTQVGLLLQGGKEAVAVPALAHYSLSPTGCRAA